MFYCTSSLTFQNLFSFLIQSSLFHSGFFCCGWFKGLLHSQTVFSRKPKKIFYLRNTREDVERQFRKITFQINLVRYGFYVALTFFAWQSCKKIIPFYFSEKSWEQFHIAVIENLIFYQISYFVYTKVFF